MKRTLFEDVRKVVDFSSEPLIEKIDISNVADYFMKSKGYSEYDKKFVSLVSPFETAWYEFDAGAIIQRPGISRFGVYVTNRRWILPYVPSIFEAFKDSFDDSMVERFMRENKELNRMFNEPMNIRIPSFRRSAFMYGTFPYLNGVVLLAEDYAFLDENGSFLNPQKSRMASPTLLKDVGGRTAHSTISSSDEQTAADMAMLSGPIMTILNLAISFMHCKNVIVEAQEIPPKLQKKHMKKHGKPKEVYKILRIDPTHTTVRGKQPTHSSEISKSLHICRGHFRTYTEEKKLFGRLIGSFWIPAHLRGSAEIGEVKKDYSVDTEKLIEKGEKVGTVLESL
jgi:hypothetical protein